MTLPLFVMGPLRHAPLRDAVLGPGHRVTEARLPGHRLVAATGSGTPGLPVAVPGDGVVAGLLVEGLEGAAQARADAFAAMLGYGAAEISTVAGSDAAVVARAYLRDGTTAQEPEVPWDFDAWCQRLGPVWVAAAPEALAEIDRTSSEALARKWPTMCMRAATRVRAAQAAVREVRADLSVPRDVEILLPRTPYTEYFSLEDPDLRFRRFDGGWSDPVRRAAFVGGDAATVLPYDPVLDAVLLVEQFRAGPLVRGDPRPWTLEPIAGRIDPGERPEDTARREAKEEAGLDLGTLHRVADYYPTPGAVTEFLFSFVALADLAGQGGRIGGESGEHEDIRTHVVRFDRLMALVDSGEAGTGPLILSIYWLALNRSRLRA